MRYDFDDVDWTRFTGRPLHPLNPADFDHFAKKTILITGAGGSIGSALAKTVAALRPEHLILLDHSEAGLAALQRSLGPQCERGSTAFILGDLRDGAVLREVFETRQVHMVFHAAACKHVPLLEDNPFTAVSTNALGTDALIHAACAAGVEQLVLLSTDKAVEPVSVLGVTKRIAELTALSTAAQRPSIKVLRLCNVLASTGSVASIFAEQIRAGRPVTITHREARRYFITMQEAVRLLLHVSLVDGAPSLWVPRVEMQHTVESLAIFLRFILKGETTLTYTGLRSGDKLFEKMWSEEEFPLEHADDSLLRLKAPIPSIDFLSSQLTCLRAAVSTRDLSSLFQALQALVPTYQPSERVLVALRGSREGAPA